MRMRTLLPGIGLGIPVVREDVLPVCLRSYAVGLRAPGSGHGRRIHAVLHPVHLPPAHAVPG